MLIYSPSSPRVNRPGTAAATLPMIAGQTENENAKGRLSILLYYLIPRHKNMNMTCEILRLFLSDLSTGDSSAKRYKSSQDETPERASKTVYPRLHVQFHCVISTCQKNLRISS